jgi:opacity protein-like surface antigen
MRRKARWGFVVPLAAVMLGLILTAGSPVLAAVKESDRTEAWEFLIPIRYLSGQKLDFDHGTSVDLHDDLGWGFGFGYNFNEHMNLDFEFGWTSANYTVKWASADTPALPPVEATGYLDVSTTQINFTYNFMPKTVTPYISAGIGWNWFDTNIPVGPPQTGCWWDPWYGYICQTFTDTASGSGFSYGFGAGVRIEPKDSFFIRLGLNDNWQDLGSYNSSPDFLSYRLDMGWKF